MEQFPWTATIASSCSLRGSYNEPTDHGSQQQLDWCRTQTRTAGRYSSQQQLGWCRTQTRITGRATPTAPPATQAQDIGPAEAIISVHSGPVRSKQLTMRDDVLGRSYNLIQTVNLPPGRRIPLAGLAVRQLGITWDGCNGCE